MKILVPHYEVNFFNKRLFHIEFDKKKYLEISGEELSKLSREGSVSKNLMRVPEQKYLQGDLDINKVRS